MGSSMNGKKSYTMPNIIEKKPLLIPKRYRSDFSAITLSTKFIHIGIMNSSASTA